MAMSYLFQFLDKSALGFTAILTLREDLHLSGLDYSWAGGIYYVGYLVASYPAAWLLVSTADIPTNHLCHSRLTTRVAIVDPHTGRQDDRFLHVRSHSTTSFTDDNH